VPCIPKFLVIPIYALSYMVTPLPLTCECGFSTIEISQTASVADKHITFPTEISIVGGILGHSFISLSNKTKRVLFVTWV